MSNLDKVLYPLVGFTKAQVIDYYVRVAPTMLTHVGDRGITLRRWPNGVNEQSFFEKRCPTHRPEWLGTCLGPGDRGGSIGYCCLSEVAALAWTANLAALEIHAPMARCADIESPTMLVFDLDPGAPATIVKCCSVALGIRDILNSIGLQCLQRPVGQRACSSMCRSIPRTPTSTRPSFALAVGQLMEKQRPKDVVVTMAKAVRPGKIFIDWSQNSRHKTTIAPYSLRGEERPTVSTPISWDEVAAGAEEEPLIFDALDVLDRIERLGDLFAPTASLQQQLPGAEG